MNTSRPLTIRTLKPASKMLAGYRPNLYVKNTLA